LETMSVASSTSLGDHPDLYDEEDGRGVSSLTGAQREHNPGHRRTLTRNALLGDEVPVVGVGADGKPVRRLLAEGVTDFFGPLVRTLSPGSSFGELALLQRSAMRTASVLVPSREEVGEAAEFRGVELIRVTRECYDQTVNMLMSQQLSELLQKVAKVRRPLFFPPETN
jgi:CRP-like cAMP-binding protein